MEQKQTATPLDLIDFSDDVSGSSTYYSTQSVTSNAFLSDASFQFSEDSVSHQNSERRGSSEQKMLELEDYVRKPRSYSRERLSSNEERPPPLPPKRKIQSRKNERLANRLMSAGIIIVGNEETEGSTNAKEKQEPSVDTNLINLTPAKEQISEEFPQNAKNQTVADASQTGVPTGVPTEVATEVATGGSKTSLKDLFLSGNYAKPKPMHGNQQSLDFESRLRVSLGSKETDLIAMNLMELEIASKPQHKLLLPPKNIQTSNRSSSWEDIATHPHNKPVNSLSVEDLESFISDFSHTSVSQRENSACHGQAGNTASGTSARRSKENGIPKLERTNTLPPPRPVPPKFFNRLSLPVDLNASVEDENLKLYFGDGIFDLAEERNEEAKQFCAMIAELRKHYTYTNMETNPGIITDSITSWRISNYPKELSIQVFYEGIQESINITFNVFSKVQDIVLKALLIFQETYKDIDTISKNKYIFKVCGESCYLEGNDRLINYVYVQNCLKLGEDICVIVLLRSSIQRDLSRDMNDDKEESVGVYFKHFFDIKSSTAISRQGLAVLLDTYNREVEELITSVSKMVNPLYVPEKLIQVVKALSLSLACIESTQVHESVNLLLSLKPSPRGNLSPNPPQCSSLDFNRLISKDSFDKGRFNIALEKLTSAVFALVDSYCRAFDTNFNIHNPSEPKSSSPLRKFSSCDRASSDTINDKFFTRVCSVHRIPPEWKSKYDLFGVECGLFYGGKQICKPVETKACKGTMGFYEHIKWDDEVTFDIYLKEIPRETKICFSLFGFLSPKKQTRDTKGSSLLAWISTNLFDFKGIMISGSHLFGLLSGSEQNPAATCSSSNIQDASSIILRADFPIFHTEVIFPEALIETVKSLDIEPCSSEVSQKLDEIISKGISNEPSDSERLLIWENRMHLRSNAHALPYVLQSLPNLRHCTLAKVHEVIRVWQPLSPVTALGLLTAHFPDIVVRTFAVNSFNEVSESELCEYLPQLVQALKYEAYHGSALSKFMLKSAMKSPKVAHYLFWHLKYYTGDAQFSQRFQIILGGLLGSCGAAMKDQLSRQDLMVRQLAKTTQNVKEVKENLRRSVLVEELQIVATEINGCMRLPVNPSNEVKEIVIDNCSYYNSFTVPLSIVFKNSDSRGKQIKTLFKVGDDLRKDLVTLQLFRVMNRLWLSEGLDLKMITYECMPTAPLAGMIQLVPDAVTLREIHVQHGVTGSFKDDVIGLWLQKYNASEGAYKNAVDNFSASCAAYCVATYVLGIGDRHNDNIMVTQKGHLFHIDFSKFMGNVQKFGTIRRDRVPFVLTPDMAFVINSGEITSYNFQHFIELCCDAFNVIRKNADLILNLLGLMVSSGIPYLSSSNDIEYVRNALQLHLTDAQATVHFTRLLETSLSSKSTQWNFFIHNMAHLKDAQGNLSSARAIFSFSNKVYSKESDGEVISVRCVDIQKRYIPDKHYIFVLNILRQGSKGPKFVFRKYDEFQELHAKLSQVFGSGTIPSLPGRVLVGRNEIRNIAVKRRQELDDYLVDMMRKSNLASSEIFYTFLHSFIRDEQDSVRFGDILLQHELGQPRSRIGGELKLSYQYSNGCLNLLVMHARNLAPRSIQGTADPYVKCYILPDPNKSSKRKTRICRRNLNPTYNQTLSYKIPLDVLHQRVMQVTVWDNDAMGVNDYLGGVNIYPSTHDLSEENTQWFELKDLGLGV